MEVRVEQLREAIALAPFDDEAARERMIHPHRFDVPPPARWTEAAVLVLFYPGPEGLRLLLTRRTDHLDHHRGQISCPGGAREEGESLLGAALREAEEEVGIAPGEVTVLGELAPLRIPVSGYVVHPFVGLLPRRPEFRPDPREVAEVIEVPLAHLLREETRSSADLPYAGRVRRVPVFDLPGVGPPPLWGATAMILSGLIERLRALPREE
jgi:8-oxo-dGTP pyrophosphatase MutT (NUDIX family)